MSHHNALVQAGSQAWQIPSPAAGSRFSHPLLDQAQDAALQCVTALCGLRELQVDLASCRRMKDFAVFQQNWLEHAKSSFRRVLRCRRELALVFSIDTGEILRMGNAHYGALPKVGDSSFSSYHEAALRILSEGILAVRRWSKRRPRKLVGGGVSVEDVLDVPEPVSRIAALDLSELKAQVELEASRARLVLVQVLSERQQVDLAAVEVNRLIEKIDIDGRQAGRVLAVQRALDAYASGRLQYDTEAPESLRKLAAAAAGVQDPPPAAARSDFRDNFRDDLLLLRNLVEANRVADPFHGCEWIADQLGQVVCGADMLLPDGRRISGSPVSYHRQEQGLGDAPTWWQIELPDGSSSGFEIPYGPASDSQDADRRRVARDTALNALAQWLAVLEAASESDAHRTRRTATAPATGPTATAITEAPPGAGNGSSKGPPDDRRGLLSCKDLAIKYQVKQEVLRKRLDRFRLDHDDGYVEVQNRKPQDPKYLFLEAAVLPIIHALRRQ